MQVGGRDDQQRGPVDAEVVQPVADERAALEGRGLDVVQRDREPPRPRHAATVKLESRSSRPVSSLRAAP
jgi:hypothetical protein